MNQSPTPDYGPEMYAVPGARVPRSYVKAAVVTLVLYFCLWLPGLIANIIYWRDVSLEEREARQRPEGKGCLLALFIVCTVIPIIGTCAAILIAGTVSTLFHNA
ncbi:MAG TPA: hypothetical protein VHV31_08460 [Nitrolancea sp.]|nr:hypothetical protein [Nitrolancea sp.]